MSTSNVRVIAYDSKTGVPFANVPYTKHSWSEPVNEAGDWSVDVVMSREATALNWRGGFPPWKTSLAIVSGDSDVLQAGPLIARKWDPKSSTLTLTGKGARAFMTKRLAIDSLLLTGWKDGEVLIDEDHPADRWELTYGGTLRDIAYRFNISSNDWDKLPISEHSLSGTTPHTRRYNATDLRTIDECLTDLSNCADGPELAFRGYITGGKIAFDFVGGDPELVTNQWQWNTTVPGVNVYLDALDEDGSDMANSVFMIGGRHDDIVLVARSENRTYLDAGFPLLQDGDLSHTTVSELATLKDWADGSAQMLGAQQESFSLKVGTEYRVRAGDWADVLVSDAYIGTRTFQLKITQVSGDESDWQTVQAVLR